MQSPQVTKYLGENFAVRQMKRPPPGTFGARLLECLEDAGVPFKQKDMAAAIGVSGQQLRKYFYDEEIPRMKALAALADQFKVDMNWLAYGAGSKHTVPSTRIAQVAACVERALIDRGLEVPADQRARIYEFILRQFDGRQFDRRRCVSLLDDLLRASGPGMPPKR